MRIALTKKRRAGVIVLATAILVAAPVYAGYQWQRLTVCLPDVNDYGNVSNCGGQAAEFCALINTRNGRFCGNAWGQVTNNSRRWQCYKNLNLFNYCDDYYPSSVENGYTNGGYEYASITCSRYWVDYYGNAFYCASGYLEYDE